MKATLEQMASDLRRLVALAQQGEEVVITSQGCPVAKLTGLPQPPGPSGAHRDAWLRRLAGLRTTTATGKTGDCAEAILDDLRSDRG
jgi:antitoxin (DNA-binding transcriptional repressor) of toxin-antitoxin stability system